MVKRPIIVACIGYIIGLIYGLYFVKQSIAIFLVIALIIFMLNLYLSKNIKRYIKIIINGKAIIILVVFIIIGAIRITSLDNSISKLYQIDKNVMVRGIVTKVEKQQYSNKYTIKIESINNKRYSNVMFLMYSKDILDFGDCIEALVEYREPLSSRNFKGFSYKDFLKQSKIYGIIEPIEEIKIIRKNSCSFVCTLANNFRNMIIKNTNTRLSKDAQSLFLGILIGEKNQISSIISTDFRQSNMAHILAVSGAHVSLITLIGSILLTKAGKNFRAICIIVGLLFFMILVNFTPSVVRACIMAIVSLFGKIIYKKSDIYSNMGIACLLILFENPYNVLNVGFQLTFLGTLGIIVLYKKISIVISNKMLKHRQSKLFLKSRIINKLKKLVINIVTISLCVQIMIAPIIITNFNTLSFNFLISGILATPVFAGIMTVGILALITIHIGVNLFPILEILINLLIFISKCVSQIPFLTITLKTPNIIWIISYYLILLVLLFSNSKLIKRITINKKIPKNYIKKFISILLIICLITQMILDFNYGDLRIYFIDVGQGDSTLIITPKNKTILIDGGGVEDKDYDIGQKVLVPYLLDRRINSIDYIIVSHFDNDHCGGLKYLLKTIKVKNILISKQSKTSKEYKEFIEIAKTRKIKVIEVKQGDIIKIDNDTRINILYPSRNLKFDNLNNNSIVAKFVYMNFSILLCGDIEKEAEKEILSKYNREELNSTILKVAHHGSKTSTTENFLEKIMPKIALIGVGENNAFGHPNIEVLDRLKRI